MWLLRDPEGLVFRYSAYRFAVYRLLLGASLFGFFLAPPRIAAAAADAEAWLHVSLALMSVARLFGVVLSALLFMGYRARVAAGAAVPLLVFLVVAGRMDPRVGVDLAVLLGLTALYPQADRLRVRLPGQGEGGGVGLLETAQWFRLVWIAAFFLLFAVPLWRATEATPWLLGAGAIVSLRIFLRGPVKATALVAYGFALAALFTTTLTFPLLVCWLLIVLLSFNEAWLAPIVPRGEGEQTPESAGQPESRGAAGHGHPPFDNELEASSSAEGSIVFFDGVCSFCNDSVRLILEEEWRPHLRFAALQGDTAQTLLGKQSGLGSIVLWERGAIFERSDAALCIARSMGGFWTALWVLRVVPRELRDAAYDFVARHRYEWFGKLDACPVPPREQRARFLP